VFIQCPVKSFWQKPFRNLAKIPKYLTEVSLECPKPMRAVRGYTLKQTTFTKLIILNRFLIIFDSTQSSELVQGVVT
jgi:hypothetical protein